MTIWDDLAAPFPEAAISWRAQSLTKAGDKAMALAYLDARDVRRRLNEVLGPENWQNEFRDCGDGKLSCRISVRVDGEWIHKEDGAGETQVEAEKGAFSSALKRAAVAFGVGEYLYDMPAPWVPCESYDKGGKLYWSKWKDDPWNHVRKPASAPSRPSKPVEAPKTYTEVVSAILAAKTMEDLQTAFSMAKGNPNISKKDGEELIKAKDDRKAEIIQATNKLNPTPGYVAPSFEGLEQ